MRLSLAQRLSALVFLASFVAHAHFVDAHSARGWQVGLLAAIVSSGLVHLATGLYVVVTDHDARPHTVRLLVPALALASGALLVAAGSEVATSSAAAPTPGHVPGAGCLSCHDGTEARHGRVGLPQHLEAGVGCEACHDVVDGERPRLVRRWPAGADPCVRCHDGSAALPPRASDTASPLPPSASATPSVSPPAPEPRLCAVAARHAEELEAALGQRAPVPYPLRSLDRTRFQGGVTTLELRAATLGEELVLDATWLDRSADAADSLSVMLLGDEDLAPFHRLGCSVSCHLGGAPAHSLEPAGWAWLVTVDQRGAISRRVTSAGLRAVPGAPTSSFRRDPGGLRTRLHLPLSRARAPNGALTVGVALFDGALRSHAIPAGPIEVWLSCGP